MQPPLQTAGFGNIGLSLLSLFQVVRASTGSWLDAARRPCSQALHLDVLPQPWMCPPVEWKRRPPPALAQTCTHLTCAWPVPRPALLRLPRPR